MNGSPSARRTLAAVAVALAAAPLLLGNQPGGARPASATFERYAVAADEASASDVGAAILEQGGTAADAAAATMLALGITSPLSSGFGGGGFALYYRASDRSVTFLDFRERAPAASRPDMFAPAQGERPEDRATQPSQVGGLAVGVPGEPAGIEELLRRFGRLGRRAVVAPAIRMAQAGVPISEYVAGLSMPFVDDLRRDPIMRGWVGEGETAMRAGALMRNAALARTLEAFSARGARAVYRGAIAQQIARAVRQAGGILTPRDLADYRVVERTPLEGSYFGYRFVTAPPPSAGGYTMLASLAQLERVLPRDRFCRASEPNRVHALAESWKGPFRDRAVYFGDPDHVTLPLDALRAAARTEARARAYDPRRALDPEAYAMPLEGEPRAPTAQPRSGGTTHLCVVDAEGNVAAVTTTVNLFFGARFTAAGLVMNDEMDDFARAIGAPNAFGLPGGPQNLPGPGKRPVSTMTPTIVIGDAGPVLCIGGAGGSRIVTATEQVALRILAQHLPLDRALAAPRFHHQGFPNVLNYEPSLDAQTQAAMRGRGHRLEEMEHIAAVQAIQIRPTAPRLLAASDPRKGGAPAGR